MNPLKTRFITFVFVSAVSLAAVTPKLQPRVDRHHYAISTPLSNHHLKKSLSAPSNSVFSATVSKNTAGSVNMTGLVNTALLAPLKASGDVVPNTGKLTDRLVIGYECPQTVPDDGVELDGYWHFSNRDGTNHAPVYPYIDPVLYAKANLSRVPSVWGAKLKSGQPALIYDCIDPAATNVHVGMMRRAGAHVISIERFIWDVASTTNPRSRAVRNAVLKNTAASASAQGLQYYVEYDISGTEDTPVRTQSFVKELKMDWEGTVRKILLGTHGASWAKHEGKPVVMVWKGPHPVDAGVLAEGIDYLRSQGLAVIIGVNWDWRMTDAAYFSIYRKADLLSPWCQGTSPEDIITNVLQVGLDDVALLQVWNSKFNLTMDYMHLLCSGPSIKWTPGKAGNGNGVVAMINQGNNNLYQWNHWRVWQMLRAKNTVKSSPGIGGWLAMFDDYSEAESLHPVAPSSSYLPYALAKNSFYTLDFETGKPRSSDYNIRLAREGVRAMSQNQVLPAGIPIDLTCGTGFPAGGC